MKNQLVLTVLGGGAWGTAIAAWLSQSHHEVRQWCRCAQTVDEINRSHTNSRYLPGVALPRNLTACTSLAESIANSSGIVLVVPSHAFEAVLIEVSKNLPLMNTACKPVIVWGTKGLAPDSGQLLDSVVEHHLGTRVYSAVLSGPSFAKEIAAGLPAALVVGSKAASELENIANWFRNDAIRIYTSTDIVGVQLGGAVKNVIAIAAGISDGLELGANARSALITRGLAEMRRLNKAMGGSDETLMGLAGVGDLILTCSDNQSRNRRTGIGLGQGKKLEFILNEIEQEAEGVRTAKELHQLGSKLNVEMPITARVYRILFEELSAMEAVKELLARDPRQE